MSAQTELLRELVARFNERQPIDVARYFAPSFQLSQPGGRDRRGLEGAQDMVDALYALGEHARLTILGLIEQDEFVAVRWQLEGMSSGTAAAMMAIYRFEGGRIADDWGIAASEPWRR